MPSVPLPKELLPSFLDRLIDAGRTESTGPGGYSLEQTIDAVRADLEELLNTRQSRAWSEIPYAAVRTSLLAYGLPDLNSIPGASSRDSQVVAEHIGAVVERYEPRLKKVRVNIVGDEFAKEDATQLKFQIEAVLNVDPAPEVGFETVVELSTGQTTLHTTAAPT
jgi:type VI secretion system protein ImpF